MKSKTVAKPGAPETIGRKFQAEYFMVHSRGTTEGEEQRWRWFGWQQKFDTIEEAKAEIARSGKSTLDLGGGFTLGFDPSIPKIAREFRIVKVIAECEVVHLEKRLI